MKCPACGHEFANPTAQAGGRAGGAARVAKGFSSPAVQAKALATRKRKARGVPEMQRLRPSGRRHGC